jgi:hypothetical protein
MKKNSIFHAGSPIEWKRMTGPLRGGIVATMIFEGLAESWEEVVELIECGQIEFSSNHDHDVMMLWDLWLAPFQLQCRC